ncbi:MAG: glycoside hydrolase family 13 protein [Clostridia bacterium]|nr:glycoside hydrolase family 13 protein [Clostridia bacterium]
MLYHDSHDALYRAPIGPVKAGQQLTVRFWCDESDRVILRTWDGAEQQTEMQPVGDDRFEATITVPETPMLFWYDFIIPRQFDVAYYGTSADQLGGVGAYSPVPPRSYQVTVYDPEYKTPEYMRHGVVYQIYPDRFFKDKNGQKGRMRKIAAAHPEATFHEEWNEQPTLDRDPENGDNRALDFFGGTLRGIKQKLDYLQELGVSVLYLNPIFRARSNHRYDTGSYEEIDPIVGDDKAFDELIAAAEKRGMRVMLDGVFSHVGCDSQYFNRFGHYDTVGAYQSKESPYADWFSFEEFPTKYNTWWGFYTLPAVNKDNPVYREYLLGDEGILPRWIKRGACGWRLDVVDELPMDMVCQMRTSVKKADPDSVLLGEVWEDASNKTAHGSVRSYCLGDSLDSVMNYPLRRGVIEFFNGVIDAHQLRRIILNQQEVYPAPFYYSLMNLLGSHDRVRILNAFCGYEREGAIQMDPVEAQKIVLGKRELKTAKKRYVEAVKLMCALPGAPTIYYGDEIGMTGMADPWCRGTMAWDDADDKLHDDIAKILNNRRESAMLQTGHLTVEAPDADTLIINRFSVNGKDVFGDEIDGKNVSVKISRK